MVRVASLQQQMFVGHDKVDASGLSPKQQLIKISAAAGEQIKNQYQVLNRSIIPTMKKLGFSLVHKNDLTNAQVNFLKKFFEKELRPVLTPMAIDSTRPFPFLANDTLNIGVRLKKNDEQSEKYIAVLQVPETSGRVIALPENQVILVEDVVQLFLDALFQVIPLKNQMFFIFYVIWN